MTEDELDRALLALPLIDPARRARWARGLVHRPAGERGRPFQPLVGPLDAVLARGGRFVGLVGI